MTKRNNYNYLLFALIFILACSSQPKENNRELEVPASAEVAKEKASASQISQSINVPIHDFKGLEHLLHFENDTTYVVNFWATWCKPCVAELPYFEQLWDDYGDKKFKVLLISLDFPQQIEKKLIPFIQKHQLKSEVWVLNDSDANSWIDKVSTKWSGSLPATLVYNRDAREFQEKSFETYEELNEMVAPFVK